MMKVQVGKKQSLILPLLNVLRSVKADARQIILAHLDDKTRDLIYETIAKVLQSGEKIPPRRRANLKFQLSPYKDDLRVITHPKKSTKQKRKRLEQIGGKPMQHIIAAAIPLLLNLFPPA